MYFSHSKNMEIPVTSVTPSQSTPRIHCGTCPLRHIWHSAEKPRSNSSDLHRCLTSPLVRVAIVVVLHVQSTMGSAWNIVENGTESTTGNVVQTKSGTTRSIRVKRGDTCVTQSSQPIGSARRAENKERSLWQRPWITKYQSEKEEIALRGTTCSRSADRVTHARARRKGVDGDVCRDKGEGGLNLYRPFYNGGAPPLYVSPRIDPGGYRN